MSTLNNSHFKSNQSEKNPSWFDDDELDSLAEQRILTYSIFTGCTDNIAVDTCETFDSLMDKCREPVIRDNKDGIAFCPAVFQPPIRKKANAKECSFLAFDLDGLPDNITAEDVLACLLRRFDRVHL
jgi:hypothetical protein